MLTKVNVYPWMGPQKKKVQALITGLSKVAGCWQKSPPTLSYQPATLLASSLDVYVTQQKGDNTGTRAIHGHASVTTDTDMRIFNEKTESVRVAFVWQDITR